MRALPVLLLLWPAAALADGLADTHFARNFCWTRTYDAAHLAAHPDQRVLEMELGREPAGFPSAPGITLVELRARLKGESREISAIAYCRPDGERLGCSLEGDAGRFAIEAEGDAQVLVTVGERGVLLEGREFHELRPDEGDDRAFLLRRCG